MHATILQQLEIDKSNNESTFFTKNSLNTKRRFLWYNWDNSWNKAYLPKLVEYNVNGRASNANNWHMTGNIFYARDKIEDATYNLGTEILFNDKNQSGNLKYILEGFAMPEKTMTWTNSDEAVLRFTINQEINKTLSLQIELSPYLGGGILSEQIVEVEVNGIHVDTWHVRKSDTYSTKISKDLFKNNNITVCFRISSPKSPKELGIANDGRKLGLSISKMVITE